MKYFKDKFQLPIKDSDLEKLPYLSFSKTSRVQIFGNEEKLGGFLPLDHQRIPPKPEDIIFNDYDVANDRSLQQR